MYVCENDHDPITHNSERGYREACPLCEANERIEELEREQDDLKESNEHLEAVVEKLEEDE